MVSQAGTPRRHTSYAKSGERDLGQLASFIESPSSRFQLCRGNQLPCGSKQGIRWS